MPPRSARKGSAKKPSARAKKETPSPSVVEENTDPVMAQNSTPTVVKDEVMLATEEEDAPLAAVEEDLVPKSEVDEEAAEETILEKVVEETVEEKVVDPVETPLEAATDGGSIPEASAEGKEADIPLEVAANGGTDLEASGEGKEEADGEVNKMEEEPEEEGDKQIVEEGTREGEVENISGGEAVGVGNVEDVGGLSDDNIVSDSDGDEENEEDDTTLYMQAPLTERKKQKEFELFIGGLDKGAVEEDLIKVFGVFGEIQSVRIVKHPLTQKSKGFAFIRFVSIEYTKKALAELKDGTEVKGKQIRISASQDNDTLYLGNICKTWTRDHVIETLKGYGIEQIEDILLPDDPRSEGNIKGFAFLEFRCHSDAMAAFQRLRKPDAVFGRNISAKVAFAQTPLHPTKEKLLQVKTVYLEGIPKSWDEAKVEELVKQYGEIEKIQLSRNFTSSKRKDFGFVEFTSRDSAVTCVEGINNAQLREGDVHVKANLAKPVYKGRLAKQSARGGYKVQKDGEATGEAGQSKKKKKAKSKVAHDKEQPQPKLKSSNESKPSNSQNKGPTSNSQNKGPASNTQNKGSKEKKVSQTELSAKGKKRSRNGRDTTANGQPSKKARNNRNYGKARGRPSTGFTNPRNSYSSNPYMPHQTAYAPRYPASVTRYASHAYTGGSGSQPRRSDLEPHAGYLPSAKQAGHPYEYDLRRAGAYDTQSRSSSGYPGASMVQTSHPGYSSYAGNEAGYAYPSSGSYAYGGTYY